MECACSSFQLVHEVCCQNHGQVPSSASLGSSSINSASFFCGCVLMKRKNFDQFSNHGCLKTDSVEVRINIAHIQSHIHSSEDVVDTFLGREQSGAYLIRGKTSIYSSKLVENRVDCGKVRPLFGLD